MRRGMYRYTRRRIRWSTKALFRPTSRKRRTPRRKTSGRSVARKAPVRRATRPISPQRPVGPSTSERFARWVRGSAVPAVRSWNAARKVRADQRRSLAPSSMLPSDEPTLPSQSPTFYTPTSPSSEPTWQSQSQSKQSEGSGLRWSQRYTMKSSRETQTAVGCVVLVVACFICAGVGAAFTGHGSSTPTPTAGGSSLLAVAQATATPVTIATGSPATPEPTATPSPSPSPIPTPTNTPVPPAAPQLTITFTCASAVDYSYGRVCVHTEPGAALQITVTYCSGYTAKSKSLQGVEYANVGGDYEWDWTPDTVCQGPATADVTANWQGQYVANSDGFNVG